ncbi:hypothetical protein CDL15_Pgr022855 [Punica granatum]|uniref:Secreted protein n=1 Tax=Punica granatum TaxID=22663 RepID=A0A218X3E5_PUNGR|nr:hypothetical protein CDL15_Pgr022855 [Punica granatum]
MLPLFFQSIWTTIQACLASCVMFCFDNISNEMPRSWIQKKAIENLISSVRGLDPTSPGSCELLERDMLLPSRPRSNLSGP